jgi:hypothetical protein
MKAKIGKLGLAKKRDILKTERRIYLGKNKKCHQIRIRRL